MIDSKHFFEFFIWLPFEYRLDPDHIIQNIQTNVFMTYAILEDFQSILYQS